MQRNYQVLKFFVLLSFVLSACSSPEPAPVVQIPTVEVAPVVTAVTTTPAPTETPILPTPAAAKTAVPDNIPTPIDQVPAIITPDDGPGSIPLIEEPGSPPTDRCLAHRPGQFPPPDVHLGPGRQFALIARLGNWAEVLKTEVGWHQILFGAGEVGWVHADDVELTGPCAASEPVPQRIQFVPGETSITLEGMLESPQRDFYLFRAFAGQRATIEIVSESNRANFAVSGMSSGQPYKRVEDELHSWSIELPTTQDYMLTVAAPVGTPTTGYRVFITIDPLEMP